jgi:small redox-active disulfide protein 2
MNIKVLGSGCAKCKKLEALVTEVIQDTGLNATVEKVTDMGQIVSFGVMSTPALVIDDKVVTSGTIPNKEKIKELLGK